MDGPAGPEFPATEQRIIKRGDRVRLEGVRSTIGRRIPDGWYDVVGVPTMTGPTAFQVRTTESTTRDDLAAWLPWVYSHDAGVKEVRSGAEGGAS